MGLGVADPPKTSRKKKIRFFNVKQILVSGFLETTIMITNTNSVGVVRDAVLKWFVDTNWYGDDQWWYTYPVVGETYDGFLNDTAPTSSVINLSSGNYGNVNTNTYVAHCWSDVQGFSKMFTFKGNGSTDGTYVHLGFSPELIIWKNATTSNLQGWWMADAKRDTYNVADNNLRPSGTGGESQSYDMFDFMGNVA